MPPPTYRSAARACSAACWLPLLAAQQFARDIVPGPASSEGWIVPIDLDADGDQDLVTQSFAARFLHVFERIGSARFTELANARIAISSIGRNGVAAVGDLDNDGDQDFVGMDPTGVVLTLRNNAGTLTVAPSNWQVSLQSTLCLLDLDGDGDRDLLVGGLTLTVLTNDGTGTLQFALGFPLPSGPSANVLTVADIDGDGRDDLLLDGAGVRCWMARGTGLVDETATRIPMPTGTILAIGAADVDGDGDRDVFGARTGMPTNGFLLRNNGTGRFTDDSASLPTIAANSITAVAADDDGDGRPDLLIGSTLLRNGAGGTFTLGRQLAFAPLSAIDLDGDRFADYVARSGVVRNLGGTAHAPWTRMAGFVPLDLEGDGDQDLIGVTATWRNEGGAFARGPGQPINTTDAVFGDLDGDGDPDAVDRTSNEIRCHENNGTGTFTLRLQLPANPAIGGVVRLLDHDRDGDLDVVHSFGVLATQTPGLLRNDGNWNFAVTTGTFPATAVLTGVTRLATADIDADGFTDVLASNLGFTQLLRNRGNGTYELAAVLPSGATAITPAQLDRDPELEIVTVLDPQLHIFDRSANGWTDVVATRVPGAAGPATHVTAADVDDDGDQDLLVAGGGGFLLLNDGNGAFADATRARGPFPAAVFSAADVDGDGDPDVFDGVDLSLNQQRQLTLLAPAAAGGALQLEYVGERGFGTGVSVAIVTWALSRSSTGAPLFGGRWFPDVAGSQPLVVLPSIGGRPATFTLPIPAGPTFVGFGLHLQGLVIGAQGELRLANYIATTIE